MAVNSGGDTDSRQTAPGASEATIGLRRQQYNYECKRKMSMNVALRPEVEKLIEDEIKSKRSTDPAEFLDRAVYHYVIARDLGEEHSREEIEEKIARGLAQAERGETVDGDEFFEQLRLRGEELRRRRG
jgi:predicted transcriptional regulator